MWGFLSAIPSIFGKGLQTAGQGIATGAKTVGRGIGQIPQRLGMGGDSSAMARTPDFVPPVRGGMEGIAPRALASMNPMRQMPAMPEGEGFNALTGGGASPMPDLPVRQMNMGSGLTNMAKAAEAAKPALEQYPDYIDPIRQKRDEFVNDRLEGRARWKQMAIPALLGAASQSSSGDPARMLGGAIGGFGMGAFAPKQALEGEYEMREGGADREELGREQDWQQAQARLQQMRGQEEIARKRLEQDAMLKAQDLRYKTDRDRINDERNRAADERAQKQLEANQKKPVPINAPAYMEGGELKQNPHYQRSQSSAIRPLGENIPGYIDPNKGYQPNPGYRQKAEREQGPPTGATQAAAAVDKMRRDAMQRWDAAKAMPDSDPEKAAAIADAKSALAQFNEAVKQMGDNYGDYYETGSGSQGWGYYKPRKNRSQSSSGSMGQAAGGRRNVNDLLQYLR